MPEGEQVSELDPVAIVPALGISLGVLEGLAYAALTILGEARGEPIEGQIAVAWVIRNRVEHGWRGTDYKSVVLAPKQFSCWNKGDPNLALLQAIKGAPKEFMGALGIMLAVYGDKLPDPTRGAVSYYNPAIVEPSWAPSMIVTAAIGRHRFLRESAGVLDVTPRGGI